MPTIKYQSRPFTQLNLMTNILSTGILKPVTDALVAAFLDIHE